MSGAGVFVVWSVVLVGAWSAGLGLLKAKPLLRNDSRCCTYSSAVKSAGCSSRGPGFHSQHLHGGPQPSVITVPRVLTPSSGLHGY